MNDAHDPFRLSLSRPQVCAHVEPKAARVESGASLDDEDDESAAQAKHEDEWTPSDPPEFIHPALLDTFRRSDLMAPPLLSATPHLPAGDERHLVEAFWRWLGDANDVLTSCASARDRTSAEVAAAEETQLLATVVYRALTRYRAHLPPLPKPAIERRGGAAAVAAAASRRATEADALHAAAAVASEKSALQYVAAAEGTESAAAAVARDEAAGLSRRAGQLAPRPTPWAPQEMRRFHNNMRAEGVAPFLPLASSWRAAERNHVRTATALGSLKGTSIEEMMGCRVTSRAARRLGRKPKRSTLTVASARRVAAR